jgi:hypothetical protein
MVPLRVEARRVDDDVGRVLDAILRLYAARREPLDARGDQRHVVARQRGKELIGDQDALAADREVRG